MYFPRPTIFLKQEINMIREIDASEVTALTPCIAALSAHHNQVSVNFKGFYPLRPPEMVVKGFSEDIKSGISHIAVLEVQNTLAGFCKIDLVGRTGKIDYLMVLSEHRGKGYGNELMDWAMETFRKQDVCHIEVKVVEGNDAISFYEKYGFETSARLLWYIAK